MNLAGMKIANREWRNVSFFAVVYFFAEPFDYYCDVSLIVRVWRNQAFVFADGFGHYQSGNVQTLRNFKNIGWVHFDFGRHSHILPYSRELRSCCSAPAWRRFGGSSVMRAFILPECR